MAASLYGGALNIPGSPGNLMALRDQTEEELGSNAGFHGQLLGGAVGSAFGSSPYPMSNQPNMGGPGTYVPMNPRQQMGTNKLITNTQAGAAGGWIGNHAGMYEIPQGFQNKIVS